MAYVTKKKQAYFEYLRKKTVHETDDLQNVLNVPKRTEEGLKRFGGDSKIWVSLTPTYI